MRTLVLLILIFSPSLLLTFPNSKVYDSESKQADVIHLTEVFEEKCHASLLPSKGACRTLLITKGNNLGDRVELCLTPLWASNSSEILPSYST